jgi:hypothetical protein
MNESINQFPNSSIRNPRNWRVLNKLSGGNRKKMMKLRGNRVVAENPNAAEKGEEENDGEE